MVIDSADDSDVFSSTAEGVCDRRPLLTYLPKSRNGSIVITSRNKKLADLVTGNRDNVIEVGPMTETEAIALLEKKLGSAIDWDGILAKDLAQALDLIPLAISQAASYIKARWPRSSLEKYLGTFRESKHNRIRLLKHDAGDLWRDGEASNAVFTTWQISFNYIRSKRPSAADLLALMSFFDRQGIPEWVLKGNKPTKDTASDTKTEDMGSDSNDSNSDDKSDGVANDDADSEFDEDVEMLRDYCLVTTNEQGDEFEMHRLVQLSTREWLAESGQQDIFKQQYIKRMVSAFPTAEYENWIICGSLFAHAQVALGYRPNAEDVAEWAFLLCKGGLYARLQGKYNIAEQMLGEAYKVLEKLFGKEDMFTLYSTSLFAQVLKDQGRWDKAEKLELQTVETRKLKLGADHPDTLTDMSNLASIYWKQGRWDKAEKLELQVLETYKLKLGADHPDTLISMSNLALIYRNQSRWEEAEKLNIQVMETRKLKLGADHPDTLRSMNNLAYIWHDMGKTHKATDLMEACVSFRKAKLGLDHPDTQSSISTLDIWKGSDS
jgi:tetratricopeptide (TPR) repeat protein